MTGEFFMKTQKINKKLTLNKETLAHLSGPEMISAKGGADFTMITRCPTYCYCPLTTLTMCC